MATADVALLISAISVLIALFALGWNIYRDVIIKPKVRVRFQLSVVVQEGDIPEERKKTVSFFATNHGPGPVMIQGIALKTTKLFRKSRWAFYIPDYRDPISDRFPRKLEVGEEAKFVGPYEKGIFLGADFNKVGMWDSYGRYHWAPKRDIKTAKDLYAKEFGTANERG